ncbi:MAG: hypothetical protein MJ138_02885 [Kiritimatiellae bacterium]|nr:hypothetical protein [Kiritimatiellia bacterium]
MIGRRSFVLAAAVSLAALAANATIAIWPDYAGVTMPTNVAPLNFKIVPEEPGAAATLTAADGDAIAAAVDDLGTARWNARAWRRFLAAHAGEAVTLAASRGNERFAATNFVARSGIDTHLTYRLIAPSYTLYAEVGIYERDLTSFDERPLFRNVQISSETCVNCHTHNRADPDQYLFHARAKFPGTMIVSKKWGDRKVNLKTPGALGAGVYPAWHPGGDFIAFSMNETRQSFYFSNPDKIEVVDLRSDLMLYSLADNTVKTIENDPLTFETFPAWSPDGTRLYSSRSRTPFTRMPTNETERFNQYMDQYENVRYDLVVRSFDAATRTFSEPKTVFDAQKTGLSATFPRVSPDGRWLVATVGPYGNFHVWHRDADLWLLDLAERKMRRLTELNSPKSESYHTFSSDGRWMVFSSRREDGTFTRPYFAHFDAEKGRFTKPFLLPAENPDDHFRRMLSYNVPEFSNGPVKKSAREMRKLVARDAVPAQCVDGGSWPGVDRGGNSKKQKGDR